MADIETLMNRVKLEIHSLLCAEKTAITSDKLHSIKTCFRLFLLYVCFNSIFLYQQYRTIQS